MKPKIKIIFGFAILIITNFASADNCEGLQNQVNYADSKLRQGGNSSYMNLWRKSRGGAEKKLSQCRRSNGSGEPPIHLYTGENKGAAENRTVVASNINDAGLQQLIKTCNYWINESNRNPSPENRAFRDNVCRDVKTTADRIVNPPEQFLVVRNRTLKECMKLNKVVDNEVKECMEGFREPTWVNITDQTKIVKAQ